MSRWLLSHSVLQFVFFTERWLFPAAFLFLAYDLVDTLRFMHLISQSREMIPAAMVARDIGFLDGVHFEDYARYLLLAVSHVVPAVLLLCSRRPCRYPTRPGEIIVPLAGTFSCLVFTRCVPLPDWMTLPLVPAAWAAPLAACGIVCCVVGASFSMYAVAWLGRSLGIVVSVRKVVLTGPYRYLRHPAYLGYTCSLLGLFLTACNLRMALFCFGVYWLLVWRARLEEAALCAYSPVYRVWMEHTGFFWPRLTSPQAVAGLRTPAPLPPLAARPAVYPAAVAVPHT